MFESDNTLVSRAGKLHGTSRELERKLGKSIAALVANRHEMIALTPASTRSGSVATLFRLDSDRLALVISDPDGPSTDLTGRLMQCYRMTPAEAGLVNAVVQGASLRAYAADKQIGYETARSHLKSAMAKNGWQRQGEMIADLLRQMTDAGLFRGPSNGNFDDF